MENLTRAGRDRSLDYKLSDFFIARGSWEAKVIDALAPGEDEIVLPKTSSSLFNSTNLDYLLRNIDIEDLVVTGFLTDQCIDHTVKDGADRGYYVTCLTDGCMADTWEHHEAALGCFRGYCPRLLSHDDRGRMAGFAENGGGCVAARSVGCFRPISLQRLLRKIGSRLLAESMPRTFGSPPKGSSSSRRVHFGLGSLTDGSR
jgi:hypothetical protein